MEISLVRGCGSRVGEWQVVVGWIEVLMRLKRLECAYVGDANRFRRDSAELPAAENTKYVCGSMGEG